MKRVMFVFIIAALTFAAACSDKSSVESEAAASKSAEPVMQPDGTTLMVAETDSGIKSELKTFPNGVLIQVARVTRPDGRRIATVKLRNGYTVDLQDLYDIDRAIEMSSDELVAAVKKIPGAAAYADAPPPPVNTPEEPKPEVKKVEKPQPMKVLNEGKPSKPTDKTKPAISKKRP